MAVSAARGRRAPVIDPGFFAEKGALAWVFSLDHKRIAILQLGGLGAAFAVAAIAALSMHAEHVTPETLFLSPETYARAFTFHGAVMMFLVALPGIPATIGSFVLPLSIGARNLAFPRLNLAGFHLWIVGALLLITSVHRGGADTGWTLLPPLSTAATPAAAYLMLALMVLAISGVLRAVVLVATLHMLRTEGLTWRRTPPLAWSLYAHSVVVLVAAPVLVLTMILLLAERNLGVGLFDPNLGGDPLLFQHFFWFAAHAIAYAAVLPAIGVTSEIFGTFCLRGLCARRSVLIGIIGLATVSLLGWGEHMPTSGHALSLTTLFGLVALLGLVPATHLLGSWLTSLARGARPDAPLLLALAFVVTFVLGGLAGLFLGVQNVGVHLHGTTWVVGHSHLMLCGVVLAMVAGLHYWWPKMTGTTYRESTARIGAWAALAGTLVAFVPQLILGARGLPRRMATYPAEHMQLQDISAGGSALLGIGLCILFVNLLVALRERTRAGNNPWGARGLEWSCTSPPPSENFLVLPRIEP
jgi:cytochrome c oxidase subunit 1